MEIAAHKKKNALVVSAKGRIDAVTAPQFEKSLFDSISKGERIFVINLADLEYISSAGLRSILSAARQLKTDNGRIVFSGLKGPVEEVFKISGFHSIFEIFESEEKALRSI